MRISAVNNKNVNDYWISDKTRFAYDGLRRRRFLFPMRRTNANSILIPRSWHVVRRELTFLFTLKRYNNFNNLIIKTGDFLNIEHIINLQKFSNQMNKWMNVIINNDTYINVDLKNNYLLDKNILEYNKNSKKVIIIYNINLNKANPVLNIKINKLAKKQNILLLYIDCEKGNENGYMVNNSNIINLILKGKHYFCLLIQNFLKKNNNNNKINSIFWNECTLISNLNFKKQNKNLYKDILYFNIIQNFLKINLNILTNYSGDINVYETGFLNNLKKTKNTKNIIYLINSESVQNIGNFDFVIFQGHHNLKKWKRFNMVLPTATWLENSSLHFNCFGMLQKTQFCVITPDHNSRIDWNITTFLMLQRNSFIRFFLLNNTKFFELIKWYNLKKKNYFFLYMKNIYFSKNIYKNLKTILPYYFSILNKSSNLQTLNYNSKSYFYSKHKENFMPLKLNISNYYRITTVEKVSTVMKKCSKIINKKNNNFNKLT